MIISSGIHGSIINQAIKLAFNQEKRLNLITVSNIHLKLKKLIRMMLKY